MRVRQQADDIRRSVLTTICNAGAGHTGGSLSEIEILAALYFEVMNIDPQNPAQVERDRFILSKGHAAAGLYATLAHRGYFPLELLSTFDQIDSPLQAHPDMHRCAGIDYSTGSLGQGLSVGIGIALGAARRGRTFTTFVLVGDGELQEGQLWEAFMFAGATKTKNLVAIVDNNRVQLSSKTAKNIDPEPLDEKFAAFGWRIIKTDGHFLGELVPALKQAKEEAKSAPVVVIAKTVKGKGVSFMENDFRWHGQPPTKQQLAAALAELSGRGEI